MRFTISMIAIMALVTGISGLAIPQSMSSHSERLTAVIANEVNSRIGVRGT